MFGTLSRRPRLRKASSISIKWLLENNSEVTYPEELNMGYLVLGVQFKYEHVIYLDIFKNFYHNTTSSDREDYHEQESESV
jgi:hypothetical protein